MYFFCMKKKKRKYKLSQEEFSTVCNAIFISQINMIMVGITVYCSSKSTRLLHTRHVN